MEITFNCSIVQSNPVAARVDLLQNEIENIIREKNITSGGQDIVIEMSLQIYEILNILFLYYIKSILWSHGISSTKIIYQILVKAKHRS